MTLLPMILIGWLTLFGGDDDLASATGSAPEATSQESAESAAISAEDRQFLESAASAAYRGDYRHARRDLRELLADYPKSARALEALGRLELMYGDPDRAFALAERWLVAEPQSIGAALVQAEALQARGRYDEAAEKLAKELERNPSGLVIRAALARALFESGQRQEARELAEAVLPARGFRQMNGWEKLALGRLFVVLGDLENAARAAVYADENLNGRIGSSYRYQHWEALLFLGKLFRLTRLDSGNRALKAFNDLFRINPNHPDALLERARTRLYGQRVGAAVEDCDRALLLNPHHGGALAFKTHLLLRNNRFAEARKLIDRGLTRNPRDKQLLAYEAALHALQGENVERDQALAAALEVDRLYGAAYFTVGETLLDHYRFYEAKGFLEQSIEIDPDFRPAYIALGRTLANLGLESEAKRILRQSEERDDFPYPWRYNMLKVLTELEEKHRERIGKAIYYAEYEEWQVMKHYLPEAFDRSWLYFEQKYELSPEGPILIESFADFEDFGVRTVGFSGLGALGACFGDVVTLLSPRALPFRGNFVWSCTLHHELAHVFTLKLSEHRVPRWLSEGFSVFEEHEARETWRRDMLQELFDAYHNDVLIPIEEFNAAFASPRVLFAYYQAGLFVRYLDERFGWRPLLDILRAYSRDLDTEEAFTSVLGAEHVGPQCSGLDAAFRHWVGDEVLNTVRMRPRYGESMRWTIIAAAKESPDDPELLARAAWACLDQDKLIDARYYLHKLQKIAPRSAAALRLAATLDLRENRTERAEERFVASLEQGGDEFWTLLALGQLIRDRGDNAGAIAYLERARAAFPQYVAQDAPDLLLAELYLEEEELGKGVECLERFTRMVEHDFVHRAQLVSHYRELDDHESLLPIVREALEIDPFVRSLHLDLGRSLIATERFEEALAELEVALVLDPSLERPELTDVMEMGEDYDTLAEIHVLRATALIELERLEEARAELEQAIVSNPDHPEAREMLEELDL